jgi:hypothetical protein
LDLQRLGLQRLDLQRLDLQRLGPSKPGPSKLGREIWTKFPDGNSSAMLHEAKANTKAGTKATNINKSLAPEVGFTSPALEKQHNSNRPSLNRLLTHLGACYKMHTLAGLQTGYQGKRRKTKAKQEAKAKAEAKAAAKRQRQNKNRTLGIEPKACKAWTFKG